jgi:hypothetical protein
VISAIAGIVVGVLGLVGVLAASDGPSDDPPKITITNKDQMSPELYGPVNIRGKVENLGPAQTVWAFDAHIPATLGVYAHGGPCPVNDDGEFACPAFPIGDPESDLGKPFRIWVSVLDDSDVPQQVELSIARSQGKFDAMSGASEPPGVAKDFVDTVLRKR